MDSQGALGDIINSLLNNPEIMKTVATLASSSQSAPESAEEPLQKDDSSPSPPTEGISIPPELLSSLPQMMSVLTKSDPSPEKGGDHRTSQRKELLRALRPFLSEKRCSVIDGILQFEGLAGVLDAFKSK